YLISNRVAHKNDTVHHQTGENIHLRHIELTLLNDVRCEVRRHIALHTGNKAIHMLATDTMMLNSVFSEFVFVYIHVVVFFNCLIYYIFLNLVFIVKSLHRLGSTITRQHLLAFTYKFRTEL